MQSSREFPVPEELRARRVERIVKEKDTLVVVYEGKPIRFDIESRWAKTVMNFEKASKGVIKDVSLKQAIILYLSASWLDFTDGSSTHSGIKPITNSDPNSSYNKQQQKTVGSEHHQQDVGDVASKSCTELHETEDTQNCNPIDN